MKKKNNKKKKKKKILSERCGKHSSSDTVYGLEATVHQCNKGYKVILKLMNPEGNAHIHMIEAS